MSAASHERASPKSDAIARLALTLMNWRAGRRPK